MLNTNVWARHSVEKNVDFMQNMSCSLPSPEAIHAARFMQRIHAEYRHASCVMQITHTLTHPVQKKIIKNPPGSLNSAQV